MWQLLLLLSIAANLLLLTISHIDYVDNVIYVFVVLNSMLFLLCYLNYRRCVRRHVLSPEQFHQGHPLHLFKQGNLASSANSTKAQPWFLLLGATGAGKSALIEHAGFAQITPGSPADSSRVDNKGDVGAPEACAANLSSLCHFSSEAVFVEADGKYISESRAHEAWLVLLKLLRHHRSKEPINGLILTIDIADFLLFDESQRHFRLTIFRQRINEMVDCLGIVFPVYIVFTHCDKINGFDSYFADLSQSEKTKIFGVPLFSLNAQGWQSQPHMLKQRLAQLTKQLQRQLVDKLARHQDISDNTNRVSFAQQFSHSLGFIGHFCEQLLKASAYKERPLFAGVYFTAAGGDTTDDSDKCTQGVISKHCGQHDVFTRRTAPHYLTKPLGSVFIQALFKELILPLRGEVKANRSVRRFTVSLKATLASSIMIGVIAGISFMLSAHFSLQADFSKNRVVIDDLVKSISTAASEDSSLTQSLTLLRQRFLALKDDANEFEYVLPYLALDEKRLMVKAEMETLYFHVLNLRIEQELQPLLKSRMAALAASWRDEGLTGNLRSEYYNLLKLSLMLSSQLERLDIRFASEQLVQLWVAHQALQPNSDAVAELTELVTTYLHAFHAPHEVAVSLQPWQSLNPAIALARINLANPLTADELYQKVVDDTPSQAVLTLDSVIPIRFQSYVESNTSVPWLYSQAGWDKYVQQKLITLQQAQRQSDNDWVIAQQTSDVQWQSNVETLSAKMKAVKARYFDDYARYWFNFVESIRYSQLNNIQQTQATLNALASPNGLFTELINNMAKHLYLFDNKPALVMASNELAAQPIQALAKHFPIFNQLDAFQKKARDNEMFSQFQRNMLKVNKDLFSIISSYSINDAVLAYTGDILLTHQGDKLRGSNVPSLYQSWYDTQALLERFNQQSSVQLSYLLTEPLRKSWQYLFEQSRAALKAKWQHQVYDHFQRTIAGHYPFINEGPDTSLFHLSRFFNRHDGLLWQFVEQDLNAFIADFRLQEQGYSWLGLSLGINKAFTDSLHQADRITDGFFRRDSEAPRINYRVKPTAKHAIAESYLQVHGYEYRYRNEPEEWRDFVWPSRLNTHQASVSAVSYDTGHIATLTVKGDWGLFKLIDQSEFNPLATGNYRLNWPLYTRRGERLLSDYQIKVEPGSFLFERGILHDFSLPIGLFKTP